MDNYFTEIKDRQQKNGGFIDAQGAESVFYSSLILSCLNDYNEISQANEIKQKAFSFILSKRNENWIFSKDVHVNFYVLSALASFDKKIINGEAIARILSGLISIESQEGGPYYSHVGEQEIRKKIDLAANGIIAVFLKLQDVELPHLTKLIEFSAVKGALKSEFFASICPVIYFISMSYKGAKKDDFIRFILADKGREKFWGNLLNASMAISALSNFGYPVRELVREMDYLKNLRKKDLHKPFPFEKNKFSTPELNIAFYLEVLKNIGMKNASGMKNITRDPMQTSQDKGEQEMFAKVLGLAEKTFLALKGELKNMALEGVKNTIKGNIDKQMTLMPYWLKKSLGKKAEIISDDMISQLGLMNIFFWAAFIIYDDFWDEEGTPRMLPMANLFTRNFIEYFCGICPLDSGFSLFFQKLMNKLDYGNTEILVNFRARITGNKVYIPENIPSYGDYEVVYEPSSAHILGPILLLYKLGYDVDSEEVQNLILYFRNYLIAMQINDDIYDWEEDLKKGHLSTVVIMLLKDFNAGGKELDARYDLEELKKIFWFKTLPKACEAAIVHTERSREALRRISIFEDFSPLENLINIIENAAKISLEEQKYTKDFLKSFTK